MKINVTLSRASDMPDAVVSFALTINDGKSQQRVCGALPKGADRMSVDCETENTDTETDGKNADIPTLCSLIHKKATGRLSYNTRRGYKTLYNFVKDTWGDVEYAQLATQDFADSFAEKVTQRYANASSRGLAIARLRSVLSEVPETRLLTFPRCLPLPSDRNLTLTEVRAINATILKSIEDDKELSTVETKAGAIFLLSFYLNGLAPVDLASLRVGQLKNTPDGKAFLVDTYRHKTLRPVRIVTCRDALSRTIDILTRGKTPDDYILDCYDRNAMLAEGQRHCRLSNYFHRLTVSLNRLLGASLQRRVTYYTARHGFCNLVDSLDVPRHLIQHMIGHRSTVLERSYLRVLTDAEQCAISERLYALVNARQ